MRKLLVPAAITFALAFAGATLAQTTGATGTTQEKTTEKTVKSPNGSKAKSKTVSMIGTVKEYEAGKTIKLATSKHHTRSFDLAAKDTTATVDPSVAVGSKVKLTDKKDDNGNHTITVAPYTMKAHHKAMKKSTKKTESTSSAPPSTH